MFTRHGADLEREVPITLAEALLGAEVPVSTLKGKVLLKIPAGTQNGHRFRLKGQGMPRLRGEGEGDLYARARVVLPPKLDEATARRALAEFLPLAAVNPDRISGIDEVMADAVSFKFIAAPLSREQLAELIQIPERRM